MYFNDISLLKSIILLQCLFLFSLLVHGLFECGVQNCLTNVLLIFLVSEHLCRRPCPPPTHSLETKRVWGGWEGRFIPGTLATIMQPEPQQCLRVNTTLLDKGGSHVPYHQDAAGQVSTSGVLAFRVLKKGKEKVGDGKGGGHWSVRPMCVCVSLFYSH